MDQLRETLHGCDREMKMHQGVHQDASSVVVMHYTQLLYGKPVCGRTESASTCVALMTGIGTAADQMARLDSARHSKLRHLEQYNRGITSFANWVADNKARFKGDVYGPILLEVTVADTQHAKYLEQQLPREPQLSSDTTLSAMPEAF